MVVVLRSTLEPDFPAHARAIRAYLIPWPHFGRVPWTWVLFLICETLWQFFLYAQAAKRGLNPACLWNRILDVGPLSDLCDTTRTWNSKREARSW